MYTTVYIYTTMTFSTSVSKVTLPGININNSYHRLITKQWLPLFINQKLVGLVKKYIIAIIIIKKTNLKKGNSCLGKTTGWILPQKKIFYVDTNFD